MAARAASCLLPPSPTASEVLCTFVTPPGGSCPIVDLPQAVHSSHEGARRVHLEAVKVHGVRLMHTAWLANDAKNPRKDGGERLSPNVSVCQAIQHALKTSSNHPELPIWPAEAEENRKVATAFFAVESGTGGNVREQGDAVEAEVF